MHMAPAVALVHVVEPATQKKLPRFSSVVVNFLLKKFANDRTIAKIDFAILRYTQPSNMTRMQDADDLYATLCSVIDV